MTIEIQIPQGNPQSTTRIFVLSGYPSVIPTDDKIRSVNPQNVVYSDSEAARDICLSLKSDKKGLTEEVKLTSFDNDGTKTDVISVTLKENCPWTDDIEKQVTDILERRLAHDCAIILHTSLKRDFSKATLEDARGVLWATAPVEVSIHSAEEGKDPKKAVTIPDDGLDTKNGKLSIIMSETCNGGSCSAVSLMSTKRRISAAMHTYFGVKPDIKVQ